jgi:hypothetical protein
MYLTNTTHVSYQVKLASVRDSWYRANGSIHGGDRLDEISPTVERYTFSSLSVNIMRLDRDLNGVDGDSCGG